MNWALYILLANIYLVIFYGFYKLLLDRETFFKLNRAYLLAAGLFSLMLPFLRINWFASRPEVAQIYLGADQLNGFITQVTVAPETTNALNTGNIIVLIYLAGVLFFSGRLLYKLIGVNRLFKKNSTGMAFSFLNRKKIDLALQQVEIISKHEEIHIRQYHTLDVIFFELLNIVNWFNPVIYFYKRTIKHVHEFLADEEAANFQGNKDEYSLLLLSSTFGVPINKLTNTFFNSSLIKKRIFMLHKERSKKAAFLKYGLCLPLFTIMLLMSSATIRNNAEIRSVANRIPTAHFIDSTLNAITPAAVKTSGTTEKQNAIAQDPQEPVKTKPVSVKDIKTYDFAKLDAAPMFKGGMEELYRYLKRTIKYPQEAKANNIQGKVFLSYIVDTDGSLKDIKVLRGLGYGLDEEAVRAIKASPRWIPGKVNGKAVRVQYSIPISFTLAAATTGEINNSPKLNPTNETIRIETGKDAPQYIIDGKVVEDGEVTQLQMKDIESISIQKGKASNAPTGSPERNGVIIITTKKAANKH